MALLVALLVVAVTGAAGTAKAQSAPDQDVQEQILEATVVFIAEEREIEVGGRLQLYQKLELSIVGGPRAGEVIVVEHGTMPLANVQRYRLGDRVFVRATGAQDADAGRAY